MVIFAAILVIGLMALVIHYWRRFSEEGDDFTRSWFLRWLGGGVLAPVAVWLLMNIGTLPFMPPLTTQIGHLQNSGHRIQAFFAQMGYAEISIITSWTAFTFGWFAVGMIKRARNKEDLILALIVWSIVLVPLVSGFLVVLGWPGTSIAALLWVWPFMEYLIAKADFSVPAPAYSRAIGKIKFGKYAEAELAIVSELEKCDTDFDGWMMLADLYAHQFKDLAEAERTVCQLCDDPNTTLSQVSIAMHRLADWQLQLRRDPMSARRVLEEIPKRMPGTHLAAMAQVRINQLPASPAELDEQQQKRKVHMPALSEDFNAATEQPPSDITPEVALLTVNQLVEKLNEDPNDSESREKLARVFAEQLGKFDLAIDQLESLADVPSQPPEKVAEWLGMIAAWQLRLAGDGEAAHKTLERLVHEFPQSAQAFAAQRRLTLMDRKARARKVASAPRKPDAAKAGERI